MYGQSFSQADFGTIAFLIVLEALLSADNALVLAILVRHLDRAQQKKALMYGLAGAFVLRTGAIVAAALIIKFWWIQIIGGLYLVYLLLKHFISLSAGSLDGKKMGFWPTVVYLNLVDLAFALDSVLVAVAVVNTTKHPEKTWVVVAGAIIGIVLLRFAASFFIRILERYPLLDHVAYLLVGWAGLKLTLIGGHSFETWYLNTYGQGLPFAVPEMPAWLFWGGMGLIAGLGSFLAVRYSKKGAVLDEEQALEIEEIFAREDEAPPNA